MALDERDYYNPKEFRRDRQPQHEQLQQPTLKDAALQWLIILAICWIAFALWKIATL